MKVTGYRNHKGRLELHCIRILQQISVVTIVLNYVQIWMNYLLLMQNIWEEFTFTSQISGINVPLSCQHLFSSQKQPFCAIYAMCIQVNLDFCV